MEFNRRLLNLFSIMFLVLPALACRTVTNIILPNPSSPVPAGSGGDVGLSMDWLVTADELNSFSADIGIVEWKSIQDTPGQNRICRTFQGASWSVSPNEGMNCIFKAASGSSFESVIKSMFTDGQLVAGEQPVNSDLNMDGEFAVYAGNFPNGHGVYDLILYKDSLVYWSSVTLGMPAGETPAVLYESAAGVVDAFLENVININLAKSK